MFLNFALFLLGVAATSFGSIATAPPNQNVTYYTFLIVFLVTLIAGTVLLAPWASMHRSVASLVVEIKAQMPANPAAEQGPSGPPEAGDEKIHTPR